MLLRLARQLFDVVTYAPARPSKPMASATFISGGRKRSRVERRRRTDLRGQTAAVATPQEKGRTR